MPGQSHDTTPTSRIVGLIDNKEWHRSASRVLRPYEYAVTVIDSDKSVDSPSGLGPQTAAPGLSDPLFRGVTMVVYRGVEPVGGAVAVAVASSICICIAWGGGTG